MTLMTAPAPAATFDYTTLWAHLSDVEVPRYNSEFGGLVDVVVKGNFAYTINDYRLQVVDCSDPTSIVYRGDLSLGDVLRCDIRDHYRGFWIERSSRNTFANNRVSRVGDGFVLIEDRYPRRTLIVTLWQTFGNIDPLV